MERPVEGVTVNPTGPEKLPAPPFSPKFKYFEVVLPIAFVTPSPAGEVPPKLTIGSPGLVRSGSAEITVTLTTALVVAPPGLEATRR